MNKKMFTKLFAIVLAVCVVFSLAIIVSSAAEESATISFATADHRVSQDGDSQVWSNGGVVFTNNKADSQNAVVNNVNPVRLYAGSTITIEAPGNITSIVITSNGTSSYKTNLQNSLTGAGIEYSVDGNVYTFSLDGDASSWTMSLTGQARFQNITVNYEPASSEPSNPDAPVVTYEATFVTPAGVTAPEAQNGTSAVMPEVEALGDNYNKEYIFAGWAKSTVEDTSKMPTIYEAGETVKLTEDTTFYAVYTYVEKSEGASGVFEKYTGALTEGNYVIGYNTYAMNASISSKRFGYMTIAPVNNQITSPAASIVWKITTDGTHWYLYNESVEKYAAGNGTKNNGALSTTADDYIKWTVTGTSTYEFVNVGNAAKSINSTLRNNGTYGFACYSTSTGGALTLYKELSGVVELTYYTTTLEVSDPGHEHSYDDGVVTEPTCTTGGYTTYTCECGYSYIANETPKNGHNFNSKVVTTELTCTVDGEVTFTCGVCGATTVETTKAVGHKFEDGVCSECDMVDPSTYSIASKLNNGDVVIIVADAYKKALSTEKVATYYNKGADYTGAYANITDAELFVVTVNEDGSYTFTAKDGTVIALADSNSSLNADGANASWELIATETAGVFNVMNTVRGNYLEWYASKNNWSTYKTSTLDDQFQISFLLVEAAEVPAPEFKPTANVKLGTSLSMLYTVEDIADPAMKVEFNGKTYEITEFKANEDGTITFEFAGIGPQQMALNIKATVYSGKEVVYEFDNYSVEKNLNNIKNAEGATAELIALVNSVLIYGDESEKFVGFEGGVDASELKNDVAANEAKYNVANADDFGFTSANVNFDSVNKIVAKFYVEGEFTVTVNGVTVEAEQIAENNYVVTTDAISATQFATEYTFVITVGETTATLTYSVNAYANAMQADADMGALAQALYAYGYNAKAYAA